MTVTSLDGLEVLQFHHSSLFKESCRICRCCKQLLISALFAKFGIREIHMSELNVMCSPDFSDQDLTVEPWMKTPALLCLRFQALAEALKTNSSVTSIRLGGNKIGAEGAKAWCVGWAPQNR